MKKLTTLITMLLSFMGLSAQYGVNSYHGTVTGTSASGGHAPYGHNAYHSPLAEACITVYEHAGFGGASMMLHDDWSVYAWNDAWNDRISSIRVPKGYEVEVFYHGEFGGTSKVLREDWSVNGRYDFWNDQISSIRIRKIRTRTCGTIVPGVEVFEHSGFSGRSMRITGTWVTPSWDDFWNDRISSIRVPAGYEARVYQHGDGGAMLTLRGDWTVYDNDFWNDQISRIEVLRRY